VANAVMRTGAGNDPKDKRAAMLIKAKGEDGAHSSFSRTKRAAMLALILGSLAIPTLAEQKQGDLTNQSIEDLMSIQVTSVSKTEQTLSNTAAAVFVIAQEDIVRSGALGIPDLLRMVPGMDVAQINGNTWAISARGLNQRFSNELLVLVDGRPVYTQTFGGVFWEVLDLPMEDIERIEVIRGPGGSIWGGNAVNGVVNIITKQSSETHGGLVVAGGGNIDQGFGTLQYGGKADKMDYRLYAKYLNQDHLPNSSGQNGGDGWHMLQGGFRVDSAPSSKDALTFQGNVYSAREGTPTTYLPSVTAPALLDNEILANLSGGFVQGAWDHTLSPHSDISLQVSYDRYQRNDSLGEGRGTLDIDFQQHFNGWKRQNIVWGLNYRYSASHSTGSLTVSFVPADLATQLFGSFVQDEITIIPTHLFLTVGTKVEHNYYTGFDFMPSISMAWAPTLHHTLWAAISKADRTPNARDASIRANVATFPGPGGVPGLVTLTGNPEFKNERLIAYEMGYRTTIVKRASVDFTAYYNDYTDNETAEPSAPIIAATPPPVHFVMPLIFENLMHGETDGVEIALNWQATRRWSLSPGYAFEEIHMHMDPTGQDPLSLSAAEGTSPDHSAQLRSHLSLGHGLSWDTSAYFVDRLRYPSEPSYTRLDVQLFWRFKEKTSLSFVGQNLVRDLHEEFTDLTHSARSTEAKRSAYAKFSWQF
jgi:iron complex outermembrane recepter protein